MSRKLPDAAVMAPRCADCAFVIADNGGFFCRRYPPTVFMMMSAPPVALQLNQQPQPMPVSAYPPTQRNHWCGEYQPGLSSEVADEIDLTSMPLPKQ